MKRTPSTRTITDPASKHPWPERFQMKQLRPTVRLDGLRAALELPVTGQTSVLVRDIAPGGASSNPAELTRVGRAGSSPTTLVAVGNRLFFTATTPALASEMWLTVVDPKPPTLARLGQTRRRALQRRRPARCCGPEPAYAATARRWPIGPGNFGTGATTEPRIGRGPAGGVASPERTYFS